MKYTPVSLPNILKVDSDIQESTFYWNVSLDHVESGKVYIFKEQCNLFNTSILYNSAIAQSLIKILIVRGTTK